MEIRKLRSLFFKNKRAVSTDSVQARDGMKVLIMGIFALLVLGLFTSSEQLNAG
jgi:hypothetical protein